MQKGSVLEGLVVLVALFIIIFLFVLPHNNKGPLRIITPLAGNPGYSDSYNPGTTYSTISSAESPKANSGYSNAISIGTGNAAYAYQPYEEYITISNNSQSPINITGWKLVNGKADRTYDLGGTLRRYQSDTATIPRGDIGNVVLGPGEKAIITTGSVGNQSPYRISTFKENICSGYLEESEDYNFTPSLSRSCVDPDSEPGVTGLDNKCREFVSRLYSCRIPEFNTRDNNNEICTNCADGVPLSSSCLAFIKTHYNYASCVSNHRFDTRFYLDTWRVYLGKSWEMWADKYESISLYDQFGKLVDYASY